MRAIVVVILFVTAVHAGLWGVLQEKQQAPDFKGILPSTSYAPFEPGHSVDPVADSEKIRADMKKLSSLTRAVRLYSSTEGAEPFFTGDKMTRIDVYQELLVTPEYMKARNLMLGDFARLGLGTPLGVPSLCETSVTSPSFLSSAVVMASSGSSRICAALQTRTRSSSP